MKTIEEILNNYEEYQTSLEDRFGSRFADFLSVDQLKGIGFSLIEGAIHEPIPFTRENVLKQLKQDVEFGWEKACDERGISSSMMFDVVRAWNKVLDDGLEYFNIYGSYGKPLFEVTAKHYGWELD